MTTQSYSVTGMTCGHCAGAVTDELKELDGVTAVDVDLVAGGTSTVTVTSESALDTAAVAAALDEAGDYRLAG
jgi:copper chaperone CopZ